MEQTDTLVPQIEEAVQPFLGVPSTSLPLVTIMCPCESAKNVACPIFNVPCRNRRLGTAFPMIFRPLPSIREARGSQGNYHAVCIGLEGCFCLVAGGADGWGNLLETLARGD